MLVAHYGKDFDVKLLRANLARVGVELPGHWGYLDTVIVAMRTRKGSVSVKQARPSSPLSGPLTGRWAAWAVL